MNYCFIGLMRSRDCRFRKKRREELSSYFGNGLSSGAAPVSRKMRGQRLPVNVFPLEESSRDKRARPLGAQRPPSAKPGFTGQASPSCAKLYRGRRLTTLEG
ncbi:hypothetical protein Sfum_1070 [Syntrophobacter fumaroxidans MPOB]|uniref:Uncharacterized protein n=1 Tax=Syntrophobacter fumaroxidans (strain DSM 10017 / MPOB) TaxID=335543 RepID=A0LH62_SYNFM|nr:hypothetical protein Sfum_1070 [Syntrophobacter fumaroxidans MPOB]